MTSLTALLIGLASAILSAMGLGGGILQLPLLIWMLDVKPADAAAISLISYIPVGAISTYIGIKNGVVNLRGLKPCLVCGAVAAAAGALLSGFIPQAFLRRGLGIFMVIYGAVALYGCCKRRGGG